MEPQRSNDSFSRRKFALQRACLAIACIPNQFIEHDSNVPADDSQIARQWHRWCSVLRDAEKQGFVNASNGWRWWTEDVNPLDIQEVLNNTTLMHQIEAHGRVRRDRFRPHGASSFRYHAMYDHFMDPMSVAAGDQLFEAWYESFTSEPFRDAVGSEPKRFCTRKIQDETGPQNLNADTHGPLGATPMSDESPIAIGIQAATLVKTCTDFPAAIQTFVSVLGKAGVGTIVQTLLGSLEFGEVMLSAIRSIINKEASQYSEVFSRRQYIDFIDVQTGEFAHQEGGVEACKRHSPMLWNVMLAASQSAGSVRPPGGHETAVWAHMECLLNLRNRGARPTQWPALLGLCSSRLNRRHYDVLSSIGFCCGRTTTAALSERMAQSFAARLQQELISWQSFVSHVPLLMVDNLNHKRWSKLPATGTTFTILTSTITMLAKQLVRPPQCIPTDWQHPQPVGPANEILDSAKVLQVLRCIDGQVEWRIPPQNDFRDRSAHDGEVGLHTFKVLPSINARSGSYDDVTKYITAFLLGKVFDANNREVAFLGDPEPLNLMIRQTITSACANDIGALRNIVLLPPVWHFRMHGLFSMFTNPVLLAGLWIPYLLSVYNYRSAEWLQVHKKLLDRNQENVPDLAELLESTYQNEVQDPELEDGSAEPQASAARARETTFSLQSERIAELAAQQSKKSATLRSLKLHAHPVSFERLYHFAAILLDAYEEIEEALPCEGQGEAVAFLRNAMKELKLTWLIPYRKWLDGCIEPWYDALPSMTRLFAYYGLPRITRVALHLLGNAVRWRETRPDIFAVVSVNACSINDVLLEYANSAISRNLDPNSRISFDSVRRASTLWLHYHQTTKQVRHQLGLADQLDNVKEHLAVEYRHRDPKFRQTIERTKQFLRNLFQSADAWTPSRKHEALAAKLGSLDREQGGLAHIERFDIPKFDRYVATVRAHEQRLRNATRSSVACRLRCQRKSTLQALCVKAGCMGCSTKERLIQQLLDAEYDTEAKIIQLAQLHNIELTAETRKGITQDFESLYQAGSTIDSNEFFALSQNVTHR